MAEGIARGSAAGARGEFLLEIGCEELPAGWLAGLTEQVRERFGELAAREHLEPQSVVSHSTPRRLVLSASLLKEQPDRRDSVWGPSLKVARDKDGGWTRAAEGFARKNDVSVDDLEQAPKDPSRAEELNLLFVKHIPGRSAGQVLPKVIAALLRALSFPKRMNWDAWLDDGHGSFPFGRPIRWMVALMAGKVVPFELHGLVRGEQGPLILSAGAQTYGHRFLPGGRAGAPVQVRDFAGLVRELRERYVVLDGTERRRLIHEGLERAGVTPGIRDDHGLLAEWPYLVEYPVVVVGRVPEEFRTLPVEVLETVLVHHQKYIPIFEGERVARFAAVTNAHEAAAAGIVRGMQRVVVARLRDAAFFFAEDGKRPLSERMPDLHGVTFHQQLGSYLDKAERLEESLGRLGTAKLLDAGRLAAAVAAARLAKVDLTTLMVGEFPELQGVMGGLYLQNEGVEPRVCAAVRCHYLPVGVGSTDPPGAEQVGDPVVFGAVSMADKLDTLCGTFALGLAPRGSGDPFGLRRAAQGVIRVLLDFWVDAPRPSLNALVEAAVASYSDAVMARADPQAPGRKGGRKDDQKGAQKGAKSRGKAGREDAAVPEGGQADAARGRAWVKQALGSFFMARLESIFKTRGFPADEIGAVLATRATDPLDDVYDAFKRLEALHQVRAEAAEDYEHLAVAFKRVHNILADQKVEPRIEPECFESDAERALYDALQRLSEFNGDDASKLRALAGLRGPVDRFFDDVLVMAEDPALRANRLALLERADSLFARIADIAKLGG